MSLLRVLSRHVLASASRLVVPQVNLRSGG